MKRTRVHLSGEDCDTLRRLAPFAERSSRWDHRPVLSSVHVRDGIALATDSYSLAFAEVDCDDISFPAAAAKWLPADDVNVSVDHVGTERGGTERYSVSWFTEQSDLVGATSWCCGTMHNSAMTTLCKREAPADRFFTAPRYEPESSVQHPAGHNITLVGARPGPYIGVNTAFLRRALDVFDDRPRVALPERGPRPLWLWDDDTTVLVMPCIPDKAWNLA